MDSRCHAPVGKTWHGPGACGFRGEAGARPMGIGAGMWVCVRE